MKSVRIERIPARIDDVRVVDVPRPEPAHGQVRVRMRLAPVNPSDLNFVHGTYHDALARTLWNHGAGSADPRVFFDPAHMNPCPLPPYALGGEGVGVVDAYGGGLLARRLLGKRVAIAAGPPQGSWQEWTVVDARRAVVLPPSVADEQASMFFVNPLTAFILARKVLCVPRGDWLLVTAAGSALGSMMVRLGRRFGFRTLCVVRSAAGRAPLDALGADAVVTTDTQDLIAEVHRITQGRGVGYAMDCVGGELAGQVIRCLAPGGQLVVYGTLSNSPLPLMSRDLMMPSASIRGFLLPGWLAMHQPLVLLGVLRAVKALTVAGVFHADIAETFAIDDVQAALTAATAAGRRGKVLLRLG